jgi:hypothetical protein
METIGLAGVEVDKKNKNILKKRRIIYPSLFFMLN